MKILCWKTCNLVVIVAFLFVFVHISTGSAVAGPAQSRPEEKATAAPELEKIRGLIKGGQYAEAESLARELLRTTEKAKGPESVETAGVLDLLVDSLRRGGKAKNPESRQLAERAVKIKEKVLGPDHPDVAVSLNNLANLIAEMGDYAGARPLFERALAIREKALGPDHPGVAGSLNDLAILMSDMGEYAAARSLHERALAIREKALGPDHPDVASSLDNLASLMADMGDYVGARPLYERALAIREKALGPDHPEVASTLNNLANLMADMGDYAGARPLHERALAIWEKALGPDHPEVASSLNNLANLMKDIGEYTGARALNERALAIREKALGPDHPDVAGSLGNLANLMVDMGDYAGARALNERALVIYEKALGPDHLYVATSLNNLACLLYDMGDYAGARPLYERALAIYEKALGPDHEDVAMSLDNLGTLMWSTGDYAGARPLYERALTIRKKALGPDHPDVALSLYNLADLNKDTGDYAGARPLYERALAIREKALGPEHTDVALCINHLAILFSAMGDSPRALDSALRAEEIGREHLRLTARTLPERQALEYASKRTSGLDVALSAVARGSGLQRDSGGRAWDALVKSRALVLDEMASRHRVIHGVDDPEITHLTGQLTSASQRLANLLVRGLGEETPERYRSLLDGARKDKEQAERALAEKSIRFRQEQAKSKMGFADVVSALPSGSALVASAKYNRYEPAPKAPAPGKKLEPVPSYLAFVFRAGQNEPAVVSIGTAEEVESLVSRWSEEAGQKGKGAERSSVELETAYRSAGEALRRKVWDPVAALLKDANRVFVVPDGALNLVNLSSLPTGKDKYLIETGPLIHYLSAERDLVPSKIPGTKGSGLLALGGPAFDDASMFAATAAKKEKPKEGVLTKIAALLPFRGEHSGCGSFQSVRFGPLPASGGEVSEVVALWNSAGLKKAGEVIELTGAAASEAAFKAKAPGRRVLHLATHGFFLGGNCPSALGEGRGVGGLSPSDEKSPRPAAGENPLLLSGLAMAGANHRQEAGPNEDDGVLTAEEIAALDLSGVEWAVLSACDTGIGEVKAGEGVFGLRRAFEVAGAGSLILSLWSVDDEAARQWMKRLYEARFLKGMGTAESVREASLSLLKERRSKGESTHPFYWAGFVAAGK